MIQSTTMESFSSKQFAEEKEHSQNGETESTGRSLHHYVSEGEAHILANRYKTKLCKNYLATGLCAYKARCMFAHGEHELRTRAENIRDGLVTEEAIKAFQQHQLARRVGGGLYTKEYRRAPHRLTAYTMRRPSYRPHKCLPPSFEEATRQMAASDGAQWMAHYEEEDISPAVVWEESPTGRRCYRHNPYHLAVLHEEDRLWSEPLPMEGEGEMMYSEFEQQAPYEECIAYEAPCGSKGYFPAEIYGDAEPAAEVNMSPIPRSTSSEIMERCGNGKLSVSMPMKQACSSMNMYEEDELHNNTEMILEP